MIDFSFAPRTRILTRDGTALYVDASRSPTLASASPGQSVSFDRCSWLPKIGFPTLESYIMHPLMKFRTNTKQKHWEFFDPRLHKLVASTLDRTGPLPGRPNNQLSNEFIRTAKTRQAIAVIASFVECLINSTAPFIRHGKLIRWDNDRPL